MNTIVKIWTILLSGMYVCVCCLVCASILLVVLRRSVNPSIARAGAGRRFNQLVSACKHSISRDGGERVSSGSMESERGKGQSWEPSLDGIILWNNKMCIKMCYYLALVHIFPLCTSNNMEVDYCLPRYFRHSLNENRIFKVIKKEQFIAYSTHEFRVKVKISLLAHLT